MPLDSHMESSPLFVQKEDHQSERGLIEEGIHGISSLFLGQEKTGAKPSVRDEVEHCSAELIKAVPLFMVGDGRAYVASALLFGADQVHAGCSLKTGLTDFALGASKGALTKGVFEMVGANETLNWAERGVAMGVSSRALDVGLTRSTYLDKNGQLDLSGGTSNVFRSAFNYQSLAIDSITFGVAHYGFAKLNQVAGETFLGSKLGQNMTSGAFFGFTSGGLAEAQRERDTGERLDLGKILLRGGIESGIMSLASVPGGMQRASTLGMAPEESRSSFRDEPTMAGKSSMLEGLKTKFSDSLSLMRGDDLGLAVHSDGGGFGKAKRMRSPEIKIRRQFNELAETSDPRHAVNVREMLRNEQMGDYAEALREYPRLANLKGVGMYQPGDESVAVIKLAPQKGLPEGGVLKISHFRNGWDSEWGTRSYDAKVLIGPEDLTLASGIDATAHVQEHVNVLPRYAPEAIERLNQKIAERGDGFVDPGKHPLKQVGINEDGELVVIDYSAVGKSADDTLQELINGKERVRQEEDDSRSYRKVQAEREDEEEKQALGSMSSMDFDLEGRRQQALASSTWSPGERVILERLFMGESVEDAAIMLAVERYSKDETQNFDKLNKQAKKEVALVKKQALKDGLLEPAPSSHSGGDDDNY
ncbi:MAG TPA: hypothetical protein V6C81_29440 [Planktothrix sp.]